MNAFSRLMKNFRNGLGQDRSMRSFYGSVAQKSESGAPTYDESLRDFSAMRKAADRTGLF